MQAEGHARLQREDQGSARRQYEQTTTCNNNCSSQAVHTHTCERMGPPSHAAPLRLVNCVPAVVVMMMPRDQQCVPKSVKTRRAASALTQKSKRYPWPRSSLLQCGGLPGLLIACAFESPTPETVWRNGKLCAALVSPGSSSKTWLV